LPCFIFKNDSIVNAKYLFFSQSIVISRSTVTISPIVFSEGMLSAAGSGTTCVKALQGVNGKRPGAFDLL
jgi:hypothetical protein